MDFLGRIVQLALTFYLFKQIFESVLKLRNPQIGVSLKRVRSAFLLQKLITIKLKYLSRSSKLVRFPSIAICVNNLQYVNVSQSGHISMDEEEMYSSYYQFFQRFEVSFLNNSEGRPSPGRLRSRLTPYVRCHACMSV